MSRSQKLKYLKDLRINVHQLAIINLESVANLCRAASKGQKLTYLEELSIHGRQFSISDAKGCKLTLCSSQEPETHLLERIR